MIDFFEDYGPVVLLLCMIGVIFMGIGMVTATPTELENECIVYSNKIYCEIDNKVEEK